jgi:hypothetical protein
MASSMRRDFFSISTESPAMLAKHVMTQGVVAPVRLNPAKGQARIATPGLPGWCQCGGGEVGWQQFCVPLPFGSLHGLPPLALQEHCRSTARRARLAVCLSSPTGGQKARIPISAKPSAGGPRKPAGCPTAVYRSQACPLSPALPPQPAPSQPCPGQCAPVQAPTQARVQ